MKKVIAILGATGSVGAQAIDVARASGYRIDFLSANKDVGSLEALAREFSPRAVAMADESSALDLRTRLADTDIRVYSGEEGIIRGISESSAETVVNSILGKAGLMPTLATIESGKRLALANKESLVIAGDIVMEAANKRSVEIIPVDSEHSAIFQSLSAGRRSEVKSIILTASGGPFFGKTKEELRSVTLADTLAHPTWKMGKKITVDSATLMNKGFEIIEAAHLFSLSPEMINVVVHRESILHSAVEYIDNTVIGELSVPDMRACVQYAVDYPERRRAIIKPLNLFEIGTLSFMPPNEGAFPLLSLAKRALSDRGGAGAVLNAADEVAVGAFLSGKISFAEISETVISVYEKMRSAAASANTLEELIALDGEVRALTEKFI